VCGHNFIAEKSEADFGLFTKFLELWVIAS